MSWNHFLSLLRRWLYLGSRRGPRTVKRLPDWRKRFFHLDHLEDRAFMEPPAMSLVASASGVSAAICAVNVALAEPARAEYRTATPAVPSDTGAGIAAAGAGELPEPEHHGGAAASPAYHALGGSEATLG